MPPTSPSSNRGLLRVGKSSGYEKILVRDSVPTSFLGGRVRTLMSAELDDKEGFKGPKSEENEVGSFGASAVVYRAWTTLGRMGERVKSSAEGGEWV